MSKKIKLKELLSEGFGVWGIATLKPVNRVPVTIKEAEVGTVPTAPAMQRPAQAKPPVVNKTTAVAMRPKEQPQDKPEPESTPTASLNYKVQPGFKVSFDGKPGQYYIIRIMNTAMTNFLVVNDKIGKPLQFIGVNVEKIESDEKGKPYKEEGAQ